VTIRSGRKTVIGTIHIMVRLRSVFLTPNKLRYNLLKFHRRFLGHYVHSLTEWNGVTIQKLPTCSQHHDWAEKYNCIRQYRHNC